MTTVYEWLVEEMDGEDISDVNYFDSYAEARAAAGDLDKVALHKAVNNRHGDPEDLAVSAYAYVEAGKLPDTFDNGDQVPKRFAKEVGQYGAANTQAP